MLLEIVAEGLDIDPRSRFYNMGNMNALDHDGARCEGCHDLLAVMREERGKI